MTDVVIVDGKFNTFPDLVATFYTSPLTAATVITAWAAVNNSGVNASYKAYIFNSDGDMVNALVPTKIVVRNKFDIGPSITNQLIPAGGSLRMETSTAAAIDFRVSGVVL